MLTSDFHISQAGKVLMFCQHVRLSAAKTSELQICFFLTRAQSNLLKVCSDHKLARRPCYTWHGTRRTKSYLKSWDVWVHYVVWKYLGWFVDTIGAFQSSYIVKGQECLHISPNGIAAYIHTLSCFFLELQLHCLFVCCVSCVICMCCISYPEFNWQCIRAI